MAQDSKSIADDLEALLPELEFSRQTHVEWRDCDQIYRDRNPSIGDSAFHDSCIKNYDKRISTIKRAVVVMRSNTQAENDSLGAALSEVHSRYWKTRLLCSIGFHNFQWWHCIGQNCVRCGIDKTP